jgi:hypothetical protein
VSVLCLVLALRPVAAGAPTGVVAGPAAGGTATWLPADFAVLPQALNAPSGVTAMAAYTTELLTQADNLPIGTIEPPVTCLLPTWPVCPRRAAHPNKTAETPRAATVRTGLDPRPARPP